MEMIKLLDHAYTQIQWGDLPAYLRDIERVKTKIEKVPDNDALRAEYLLITSIEYVRDVNRLCAVYQEAVRLLHGQKSRLAYIPYPFHDYFNVYALCNIKPGHAEENAEKVQEICTLYYKLTGVKSSAYVCYQAQLAFYRGDMTVARKLAAEAFTAALAAKEGMVALCAADTLTGIARHLQDRALWEHASGYINKMAAGITEKERACAELARQISSRQDLAIGFLHSVPEWVRNGDFGFIATPWGFQNIEKKILGSTFENALFTQIQYLTYSGDSIRSLQEADAAQKVYGFNDVITDVYLDILRVCSYLKMGLFELGQQAMIRVVEKIAPDGLWLIVAEYVQTFDRLLYETVRNYAPEGEQYIRTLGTGYLKKLIPFQKEILNDDVIGLTKREQEVASLLICGMSNAEISEKLFISERTVKSHITNIFRKYNICRRGQLAEAMKESKEIRLADWIQNIS
ncbi:MAG: helix-turn-helix transcriptional regulator [bacterium]|nr:helix-turn-helix transcriptional regulator [bacterium]